MPDPRPTGLPPDVAAHVRTYLGAFLPAGEVDEAVGEVASDSGFWGDTDEADILAVAHAVLASRLRVATDVEVLVLNEDVGLTVPGIAAVLALPPAQVRRILDEALAVLADPERTDPELADPAGGTRASAAAPTPPAPSTSPAPSTPPAVAPEGRPVPPAPGPAPGQARARRAMLLGGALAIVVAAIAGAWLVGGSDACPGEAAVCVTEAVLTDEVDASTGEPGADQERFALDDPVTLWFSFERQREPAAPFEVRWYREGVLLYATDVRLGTGDQLNVSLAGLWSDQPGRYRVEVAEGDRLLVERDFRIDG